MYIYTYIHMYSTSHTESVNKFDARATAFFYTIQKQKKGEELGFTMPNVN